MQVEDFEPQVKAAAKRLWSYRRDEAEQEARIRLWRSWHKISAANDPQALAYVYAKRAVESYLSGRVWKGYDRKTACKRGHEFNDKNTRIDPKTKKKACRVCQRERKRMEATT